MENENFVVNPDLLRDLPESKNIWHIWFMDYYTKGFATVMDIVRILIEKLAEEMKDVKEGQNPVDIYEEFNVVWNKFAEDAEFGDAMLFENNVFRAVPKLGEAVNLKRGE